jgi:hypothetical protein
MPGPINRSLLAANSLNPFFEPSNANEPLTLFEDLVNDQTLLYRSNLTYLNKQNRVVDLSKPYYGITIGESFTVSTEINAINNNILGNVGYHDTGKVSQAVYVRIPFIHFLPDPDEFEGESPVVQNLKKSIREGHTLCFPDPTVMDPSSVIKENTVVKIMFTDENLTTGFIISDPFLQSENFVTETTNIRSGQYSGTTPGTGGSGLNIDLANAPTISCAQSRAKGDLAAKMIDSFESDPTIPDVVKRFLCYAIGFHGAREVPPNSNRGTEIDLIQSEYLGTNNPKGPAYCSLFFHYCLKHSLGIPGYSKAQGFPWDGYEWGRGNYKPVGFVRDVYKLAAKEGFLYASTQEVANETGLPYWRESGATSLAGFYGCINWHNSPKTCYEHYQQNRIPQLFDNGSPTGWHASTLIGEIDGKIYTIEGNTSVQGYGGGGCSIKDQTRIFNKPRYAGLVKWW